MKNIYFIKHRLVCKSSLFRGSFVLERLVGLLDCRFTTQCLYPVFCHIPNMSACDVTVFSEVIPFFLHKLLIPSRILGGVLSVVKKLWFFFNGKYLPFYSLQLSSINYNLPYSFSSFSSVQDNKISFAELLLPFHLSLYEKWLKCNHWVVDCFYNG